MAAASRPKPAPRMTTCGRGSTATSRDWPRCFGAANNPVSQGKCARSIAAMI
jgi:hypothetical protein